ncbi:unnamed protein product [Cochlearia groenlandica]
MEKNGVYGLGTLPEDCISKIVSFTCPKDACIVSSVSKTFESAAKSDIVWDKFLPHDHAFFVPPSRRFSSKKDLYFSLCNQPLLIEDGNMSLWLEKAKGKKCIMLSSMKMSIIWGDTPRYWRWIQIPEARFEKVAELLDVCWFEIRGKTNSRFLSPRTRYAAYIVFKKVLDQCYGFEDVAIEAEVGVVGKEVSRRLICFDAGVDDQQILRRGGVSDVVVKPLEREDGWMEIEIGEFFNEGGIGCDNEIEMSALETRQLNWKCGLIIQGIEIRPAKIQY